MYAFLFDKRSLGLFLWGLAVAGLALFLAGTVFGVRMELPSPALTAAPIAFEPLSSSPVPPLPVSPGGAADAREGAPRSPGTGTDAGEGGRGEPGAPAGERAAVAREALPVPAIGGDGASASTQVAPPPSAMAAEPPAGGPRAQGERGIALSPSRELAPRGSVEVGAAGVGSGTAGASAESPALAAAGADPAPLAGVGTVGGTAAEAATPPLRYSVQVGAYGSQKNAAAMAQKMRDKGYEVFIHTLHREGQPDLLAVRFGSYPDPDAARAAAEAFHREEGTLALVRPVDAPP